MCVADEEFANHFSKSGEQNHMPHNTGDTVGTVAIFSID